MPVNFRDQAPVQLVPHSGIQFVTKFLDLGKADRFRRAFIEREETRLDQKNPRIWLIANWDERDPARQGIVDERDADDTYSVSRDQAIEPYLGKWVPLPYLRTRPGGGDQGEQFDSGPTNWVRAQITVEEGEHAGVRHTHRLTLAIDTELSAGGDVPGQPYTTPTERDAESQRVFRLFSGMSQVSWFIQSEEPVGPEAAGRTPEDPQLWVENWLQTLFREFRQASDPRFARSPKPPHYHEHSARWLAFIDLLAEFAKPPRLSFIDTVSSRLAATDPSARTVGVDLVLDVGNSRTCGILMERFPNQDRVGLNHCYTLRLRELSRPEIVHSEPFESHVELAAASFGSEQLSRLSGRTRAFFWPSPVRIGREASRLRAEDGGQRTTGGLSSPKRYLWDMDAVQQEWRFPAGSYVEGLGPPVERRVRRFVNANGDVLSIVRRDGRLFRSLYGQRPPPDMDHPGPQLKFSRSSFYTFMLTEVIWQAWVMINDPAIRTERGESGLPRQLRKVILTLPTATPVREQRIMRARAEGAIALLWDMMGWSETTPAGVTAPEIEVRWDEATCAQFVWLYGEIARKFAGNVTAFLDLAGRPRRPDGVPVSSLRVASLDIGGGTTDLMIITYTALGDQGLSPEQNFREGVRIAGDDILKLVVERMVLPAVQRAMQRCGLSFADARSIIRGSFAGDVPDMTAEHKHRRHRLVVEALVPVALALIHAYENAGSGIYGRSETRTFGDLAAQELRGGDLGSVVAYIEEEAERCGASGFRLAETELEIDGDAMRSAVNDELGQVFDILGEALDHFDVDVVLLSGRPSRMPAVVELLADRCSVSPNRLVPLHQYRAGTWYPFRSPGSGKIADPKTAVVVGALLCTYATGELDGFYYDTRLLQLRSTASFIGVLGDDGKLSEDNVFFRGAPGDAAVPRSPQAEALHSFQHLGTRQIGSRQLSFPRWVTAPLYQLSVKPGGGRHGEIKQPVLVTVSRTVEEIDPDEPFAKRIVAEASKEQIKIETAIDDEGRGNDVKSRMALSFRTTGSDAYWLDSGVLHLP